MLNSTYNAKLVGTETSAFSTFARELLQATPLFLFVTGAKVALATRKQ
jgi:hypothetical protein